MAIIIQKHQKFMAYCRDDPALTNAGGNSRWWQTKCWNNGVVKIFNKFLENSWNTFN